MACDLQVWRTSFGLGMLPLLFMLYYRIFRLRESAVWKASNIAAGANVSRGAEFSAMCFHFWHRCPGLLLTLAVVRAFLPVCMAAAYLLLQLCIMHCGLPGFLRMCLLVLKGIAMWATISAASAGS